MPKRLGKQPPLHDDRTLRLTDYLTANPVLTNVNWVPDVTFPMDLNDTLGDCVIAAGSHAVQQWAALNHKTVIFTDAEILAQYETIGGYNPKVPSSDNGCVILTALNHWRKHSFSNHKIQAFVQVNQNSLEEVYTAIRLFGNVIVGLELPLSAENQTEWEVVSGSSTWGGHCVPIMAADQDSLTCITWGEKLKMSKEFFSKYCDECWALLSMDWVTNMESPGSVNYAKLQHDLGNL